MDCHVSLPVYPKLKDEEVDYICKIINSFNIMKNKILIVSGSGFIGHNLAIYLKQNNFEPYIVDSLGVNNILSIMMIRLLTKNCIHQFNGI